MTDEIEGRDELVETGVDVERTTDEAFRPDPEAEAILVGDSGVADDDEEGDEADEADEADEDEA